MLRSVSMQVDGTEKPLPPRPAPLALALHKFKFPEQGPLSAPARMPAAPSMAMVPMMVEILADLKTGETDAELKTVAATAHLPDLGDIHPHQHYKRVG